MAKFWNNEGAGSDHQRKGGSVSGAGEYKDETNSFASLTLDRGVILAATDTGDQDKALALGQRHVDAVFTKDYGDQVIAYEGEASFLQSRINVEETQVARLDEALAHEPVEIPAPMENGGVDGPAELDKEVPPKNWLLRDKLTAGLSVAGVIGLSIASYFGIQATFEAAQLDILKDYPYLSYCLALVGPSGGLAIKFIGNLFREQRNQDRYRMAISVLGAIAFLVWIVLFAWLFEGLSGQFDPYAEVNHWVTWGFNLTQLVSEVLITAGMFAQIELALRRNSPSNTIPNPARPPLERARQAHLGVLAALIARQGVVEGYMTRLQALREDALVRVEAAIGQRMNEQPRDTLL